MQRKQTWPLGQRKCRWNVKQCSSDWRRHCWSFDTRGRQSGAEPIKTWTNGLFALFIDVDRVYLVYIQYIEYIVCIVLCKVYMVYILYREYVDPSPLWYTAYPWPYPPFQLGGVNAGHVTCAAYMCCIHVLFPVFKDLLTCLLFCQEGQEVKVRILTVDKSTGRPFCCRSVCFWFLPLVFQTVWISHLWALYSDSWTVKRPWFFKDVFGMILLGVWRKVKASQDLNVDEASTRVLIWKSSK